MPTSTAVTRHDLSRRREQLQDLQRYLNVLEADYEGLRAQVLGFRQRYLEALGTLFLELDRLEAQLHATTGVLAEALKRQGVQVPLPAAPARKTLPEIPALPPAQALPPEPQGNQVDVAPPDLRTLYRRAAMRLHPDLAAPGQQRATHEQQMMLVNDAYARRDRPQLEALLLAAGEDPLRVLGGQAHALRHWLGQCEHLVQARMRIVQARTRWLQTQPLHGLRVAVEQAEAGGMGVFEIMANRLRSQIAERRQELYIGERLQADSSLAADFLRRRYTRLTGLGSD